MNKNQRLDPSALQPHYSNPDYSRGQMHTAFIADGYKIKRDLSYPYVDGVHYDYSDRLWQWDWDKSDKAWTTASKQHERYTAALYETYLRLYFDDPALELVHIFAGVNVSNGYDYCVFGYIRNKAQS